MKKRLVSKSLVILVTALALVMPELVQAQTAGNQKIITIGTGGVTGVYYPAGGAICRLIKRGRMEHGIRCTVDPTDGSVYNIASIREGDLELGVAQSDWQYHALIGDSSFKEQGPFQDLRAIFSLHSEPFTVIARKDANIKTFQDLKGKRLNIGSAGSGSRATMEVLMQKLGWKLSDFKQITELKASEQGQALCDNKIDAFVHATGHPNGLIQEVTMSCDTVLVPVEGKAVEALMAENPFYSEAIIPGGMYSGNPNDVKSFGVKATFVSSAKVEPEVIYQVVKAVFENFDNFKTLHPVFATLDKQAMINEGNTAKLHEGARRYYVEAGLLAADAPDPSEARKRAVVASEPVPEVPETAPAKTASPKKK